MSSNNHIYSEQHHQVDDGKGSFGGRHGHKPQFTEEEIRVLQDCKRQSLLRGIIVGLAGGSVFHFMKEAYMGPFAKHKKTLRIFASLSGFMFGMTSYAETCRKNILALENSPLADDYKRKIAATSSKYGIPLESDETHFNAVTDMITEHLPPFSVNQPSTEQHYPADNRYTTETEKSFDSEDGEKQPVTFAELRQQNRQQYDPARQPLTRQPHKLPAPPVAAPERNTDQFSLDEHTPSSLYSSDSDLTIPQRKPSAGSYPPQTKTWSQATNRKNKYGDDME